MQNEKKKPGKKLFWILGCVALAIALILSLVMCNKPAEPIEPEPVTPTQPPVADTRATTRLKAPEGILVEGLREQYEIGDEVTFTVTVEDDYYALTKVKINSKKVEPDADGYYRTKATHPLDIVIEKELIYGDAVIAIEEENEHITYEGVTLKLALQSLDGNEEGQAITVEATVKDGKIAFQKMPVGLWNIEPICSLGGQIHFSPVVIAERHNETATKRAVGINDSIKSGNVLVDVDRSSITIKNNKSDKSGVILLQGQELSGSVWFGMKVQLSAEDLNATDYRNLGLNIYKNGSNRIQILSLGNGRAAVKYDNDHVKELSSGLVTALENGQLLLAVHRTSGGGLEVYAGAFADEMTKMFTVSSIKAGSGKLDQFGLDMKGPLKQASIVDLQTGSTMANVLPAQSFATQDVTICIKSTSSSLNFDGLTLTFTSNRDHDVQFTGTVAGGTVELQDVPVGTYAVSAVNLFGGKLTFEDAVILHKVRQTTICHNVGINDTVKSDAVVVDVANAGVRVKNYAVNSSKNILLQGQDLTGNVWFGMKALLSTEDLNATDYRNIGLNIYKNGSNRIQVISLGSGRAAVKYDNGHVKELRSDLVKALETGKLLLAANRTVDGKLEVYAGIHAGEMEKLFTVDSPNMGTDTLDQFGLDVQGPLEEAALENLVSGDSMASVLTDAKAQTVTVQLKSKSDHMSLAGVELTFTLKRDAGVKFTATADQDGKLMLTDVPVGTYAISDLDFFGGKLTFADLTLWEGRTAVELTHKEGINDQIGNAGAQVNAATSSVIFKDSVATTNRKDGYFFLQGQKLTGNVWFGMRVKMDAAALTGNGANFIALCIYEGGWNLIQVAGNSTVQYNYNYAAELPAEIRNALTGDGMLLAVNRAADGTLRVYGGATADRMLQLIEITDASDPKSNMGTADLDQFGFITQGSIPGASIENLTSGTSAEDIFSGFALAREDVTFTVQKKNAASVMSFAGVEFTLTLKADAAVKYTGTVDADGKLVLQDMPIGTYQVSAVNFMGRELTFSDVQIQLGDTQKVLNYTQGINDNVNNASVTVDVKNSSFHIRDLPGNGYFFLQSQNLTGNAWFGMKVQISAEDLAATDYRNIGLQTYGTGGADYVQILNNNGNGVLIKYDNSNYYKLSDEMVTALNSGNLHLVVCRTAAGKLEVYAGTAANKMVKLFVVASPKIRANAIGQFGVNINGPFVNAGIQNLTYGATAEAVMPGLAYAPVDVAVSIKAKSSRMTFEGVQLTFTLKSDPSITYTGTADANGMITVNSMLHGTYSVSSIDFLGGKLTFPDIIVDSGTTAVEITHNEGIQDDITSDASKVSVSVATSSVYFSDYTASGRNNGAFYLKDQTLTGDVWFAMRMKVSAADWKEKDGYPYIAWNSYVGNNWNFVQMMNNNGNGIGAIKYNNGYTTGLNADLAANLTGDGLLLLLNRTSSGTMDVYLGTCADDMKKMFTVNTAASSGKPALNMGNKTLDNFGFLIEGKIGSASIENMVSGTSMDDVLEKFQ